MDVSILEIKGLHKKFGGVVAVEDLNISIGKGTISSIIGPNGAGKTTVFNMITGFIKPSSGKIIYIDEDISFHAPHIVASKGISRTFQNVLVFSNMTVLENVMVGRHLRSNSSLWKSFLIPPFFRQEENQIKESAMEWLYFVGIADHAEKPAGSLPLGNQRMLEIARALAMEPKLILLDEPASGLNARETLAMGELIKKINEMDITVVLVEHDMELVMDISHKVAVINFGKCIAQGSPSDVQINPDVIAAYLGD